jgi:hypothetical protein
VLDVSAASVAQLLDNYNHAIAGTKTAAQPSSFQGAREAGEPGIRSDAMRAVALESGSGPSAQPGMTTEQVAAADRAGIAAR